MDKFERLSGEVAKLRKELNTQGVRLTLAQMWIDLYTFGYDALLHYGVNFRDLPEYKESIPDDAMHLPVSEARNTIAGWMGRLKSAINAAVRRKGFRLV
ncbi:hypothetical protein [Agrobacterium sp. CFBP2214]|uniref:hypothetical protein n=1 Tax=Agrobacterium sp. CFBP2214 TaxID=3040274 RepID=UPI000DCFA158|nr:hypothetical protein [Agrobacterium sp. CFBP2214]